MPFPTDCHYIAYPRSQNKTQSGEHDKLLQDGVAMFRERLQLAEKKNGRGGLSHAASNG